VFSLRRWSSRIPTRFPVPRGTWVPGRERTPFRLRDCHPLRLPFPEHSAKTSFGNSPAPMRRGQAGSHDPAGTTHARLHADGLGCSPFARRYWGNRGCFLFLQVLRWFPSLGWLLPPYGFRRGYPGFAGMGFPIRTSPDQSLFSDSPGLNAAGRVLHRLPAPRHPLCALSNLTIKFSQDK
jgi:hypothetical protein